MAYRLGLETVFFFFGFVAVFFVAFVFVRSGGKDRIFVVWGGRVGFVYSGFSVFGV